VSLVRDINGLFQTNFANKNASAACASLTDKFNLAAFSTSARQMKITHVYEPVYVHGALYNPDAERNPFNKFIAAA
jgi:hypothetical protein